MYLVCETSSSMKLLKWLSFFLPLLFHTSVIHYKTEACGTWKPLSKFDPFTDKPVVGGHDNGQGRTLYVCRAQLKEGVILPGKLRPDHVTCYTTFNGAEIRNTSFEILVDNEVGKVLWEPYKGIIPSTALIGGYEKLEPLYIGKCSLKGTFKNNVTFSTDLPGKLHYFPKDPNFVYVPFAGVEFRCREKLFILVCNDDSLNGDPRNL